MLRLLLCLLFLTVLSVSLSAQDFPAETVVCRNGSFMLTSPLTDGVAYQYQWERSFDGGGSWLNTGANAPELTVANPNGGILYRLAYAPDATCLADPACRLTTSATRLVVDIPTFSQGITLCAGDTAFVGTRPLTTAGNHETTLTTTAGCDSIVRTFIQLLPAYDDLFFVDLCPGEVFRGMTLRRDTIIREHFVAASGCDSMLTFEVAVAFGNDPEIGGPDRICAGETAELSAPGQYAAYAWSTGTTGESTEVTTSGAYELTLTDFAGCALTLSHELWVADLEIDQVSAVPPVCPGTATAELSLMASGDENLLYSADGGTTFQLDPAFTDLPAGDHILVVENADGCQVEETVSIADVPELELFSSVSEEITIERGDSVELAVGAGFAVEEYRWSARNFISCRDCPTPVVYPTFTTDYTVEAVAAGGCSVSKTFRIGVMDNRRMYVPTAFSPNGDDQNDRWRIFTGPRAEAIIGLQIADRWGGVRYEQPEAELPPAEAGWDGRDGAGQELTAGTYLYTATVRFTDGSTQAIGGQVTLMR